MSRISGGQTSIPEQRRNVLKRLGEGGSVAVTGNIVLSHTPEGRLVSPRFSVRTLREMEADGFLARDRGDLRWVYRLTDLGRMAYEKHRETGE